MCKKQLGELQTKLNDFKERGVEVVAISTNEKTLAEKSVREWGLDELEVGHGLSLEDARAWGLFVSEGINDSEPARFTEPGLFLVRPDGTLYASAVQTMPFARPPLDEVLDAIDYAVKKGYPARGEA